MRNAVRRCCCFALCIIFLLCCSLYAAAAAEDQSADVTILCSNVGGLPIPMLFSPGHKLVPRTQIVLGRMLNKSGADIICVQEDFQYHDLLAQQMRDYPYRTFSSGGIPAGDGLNVFSKYPIYNVSRVAWDDFYGILKYDNDGLTPKGFLHCVIDIDGVLLDVYNIHTDAYRTTEDQMAKRAQFLQLKAYIDAHSADRPVLITGDFNCTLHTYYYAEFYETMIEQSHFLDGWAEVVNAGNYLRGDDAESIIDVYNAQYNNRYWGLWDSYERLLYRDGNGAKLKATDFRYDFYTDKPDKPEALTDHAVMRCTVRLNAENYSRPAVQTVETADRTSGEKAKNAFMMTVRCLKLIAEDVFRAVFCGQPLT